MEGFLQPKLLFGLVTVVMLRLPSAYLWQALWVTYARLHREYWFSFLKGSTRANQL